MNWLRANLWRADALALAGIALALLMQIHGLPLIGGGLKADLVAEQRAHLETQADYATAQAQAADLAKSLRIANEARHAARADNTDKTHAPNLEKSLADAGRYAAANRCAPVGLRTQSAPAESAASAGRTAAEDQGASGADRPGNLPGMDAGPLLIGVTEATLNTCTTNTQRLIDARAWALGINDP